MTCEWCGVRTDGGNHGSLQECVDALKREVEALRTALADQRREKDDTRSESTNGSSRIPWKFRDS